MYARMLLCQVLQWLGQLGNLMDSTVVCLQAVCLNCLMVIMMVPLPSTSSPRLWSILVAWTMSRNSTNVGATCDVLCPVNILACRIFSAAQNHTWHGWTGCPCITYCRLISCKTCVHTSGIHASRCQVIHCYGKEMGCLSLSGSYSAIMVWMRNHFFLLHCIISCSCLQSLWQRQRWLHFKHGAVHNTFTDSGTQLHRGTAWAGVILHALQCVHLFCDDVLLTLVASFQIEVFYVMFWCWSVCASCLLGVISLTGGDGHHGRVWRGWWQQAGLQRVQEAFVYHRLIQQVYALHVRQENCKRACICTIV